MHGVLTQLSQLAVSCYAVCRQHAISFLCAKNGWHRVRCKFLSALHPNVINAATTQLLMKIPAHCEWNRAPQSVFYKAVFNVEDPDQDV